MKHKSILISLFLCAALLLNGCNTVPGDDAKIPNNKETENNIDTESASGDDTEQNTDVNPSDKITVQLPEDFVFPNTDGSTSTTNLDKAVRNAILGGEQSVAHTKTYTSFQNLLNGKCELIFTTPLSDSQLQTMQEQNFRHEAEPVAGEGFVFVVNKDNPVDTLTIEQIKGIYSGEITNWKEVGGNDAEIIAYQRNADSGSQNYMISFMGDTPLMKPVTDQIPASMSGILDVIAGYDNGIDAIGYSVYAYSDGMYENISEIKYIKVNGVEPSLTTLADGSYPLLGYNYAVFSADEPKASNVRALVKWIQSDEGQQVIADAGYIPYRQVEGLTLPEATTKTLYTAAATSGIPKPETTADYYYHYRQYSGIFTDPAFDQKVQDFISAAKDELSQYDEAEIKEFTLSRAEYCYGPEIVTNYSLVNGYLSVLVGLRYNFGAQNSPDYYYDAKTAVFDIYTGEQLELSDLFFDGVDFVPLLNQHLAEKATMPYGGFGETHDMIHDFTGLYEGEFAFTASSILFKPGTCFADGVSLSIDGLRDYMVISIPRDMTGYVNSEIPVYTQIRQHNAASIGYAEEKNGITIWYLDKETAPVADDVCEKVNAFIDDTYNSYFAPEKLLAVVNNAGITAESVEIGPFPDFDITIVGDRYVSFDGANMAVAKNSSEPYNFSVLDGQYHPIAFNFFFNAQTGEELMIGDLFEDGWADQAKFSVVDDNYSQYDSSTWTPFAQSIDFGTCRILRIENYQSAPYNRGDLSDLDYHVTVYIITQNDDKIAVSVPREFIRSSENTGAAELAVPVLSSEVHTNITDPAAMTVLCEIYDAVTAAGDVSVYFTDVEEEFWFGIGEENRYHTASTIKPVYCQYLLHAGIDPESEITLQQVSRTSSTDKLNWDDIGTTFTVGELIEYSIRNSDNQAHRLLYETFGIEGYNRYVSSFGSGGLQLDEEWEWSRATPKKMSRMMLEILRYGEEKTILLDHMKNTTYNGQIPAGTEYETAHKYGQNSGTDGYHDTAIVYAPERAYVLTIMTTIDAAKTGDANAVFRTVAGLCDQMHSILFSGK